MILNVIVTLATLFFSYYYFWKYYRKCKNQFEEIIYILFVVLETFIVLLYYLDRYNIPTMLGWNENVDTQNWLSILSGFGTNILAEILGGVILFFVTVMQINRTLDNNRERDKEERRVNNLPLLQYDFNVDYKCLNVVDVDTIFKNSDHAFIKHIILSIKNIGTNAVKKCYIKIENEYLKGSYTFPLQVQSCIDKGEQKSLDFRLKLEELETNFKFTVYYQDLLFNWYEQRIDLNYTCDSSDVIHAILKINVQDEVLLKREPPVELSI